ncbi:hypothetical protein [Pseudodesulfovibrio sp. zrk46]|uniref:hypothetical protein n=1 Tax=Pseudodesulfovibrio sp. zrk46 TaxID=2725288 RepID=UPI0014498F5D|nr:hypothetical protein [Pseudodesulfovibrio sp. zrk46]QJB56842.1 hypothetical protein HFN16_10685 [Pseudodesulfovibrio sp. zrk46]
MKTTLPDDNGYGERQCAVIIFLILLSVLVAFISFGSNRDDTPRKSKARPGTDEVNKHSSDSLSQRLPILDNANLITTAH